jgi:hypothetical protein
MGLNKELRIQILRYLWDAFLSYPSKIVRGHELMETLAMDEYSLISNLKLLKDLGYIKLLSATEGAQSYVKITDAGIKQVSTE